MYQFKHKNLNNPKNKNSFIDVLKSRKSDHKTVLLMLISVNFSNEKHSKRYQLGLWKFT